MQDAAVVLGGGGARAAYQVGALRAIARIHRQRGALPFTIVCGTSAGAINAVALAQHADDFRRGVARLARWWRHVQVGDVYRTDFAELMRHGAQFLASVLMGTQPPPGVASFLDNAPLAQLLSHQFEFERLAGHIRRGDLRALVINATSYSTGHAVSFFEGHPRLSPWRRMRRRGERAKLSPAHLLATTAIPFLFPAGRIGDEFYMDGSVRQHSPLSAVLNLGARRVLVIAVGQFTGQDVPAGAPPSRYPSFAQAAGHALSTIFLDNLAADIERMVHVNRLVDLIAPERLAQGDVAVGHVDALVLAPSRDLGALALGYAHRLPSAVGTLLGGLGSTHGTGANLMSYLLFDRDFCRALLALGYADTMARREEVATFLAGGVHHAPFLPANFG
ncbi:MAG: patatin-like phospholipase family protein [Burkholderiales bacterium]|nr:patatin-like phospholipase family protein [Burkholderiales bacterium]